MFVDANGNQFPSYEDACIYYGADTPASLAAWAEEDLVEAREAHMDAMAAAGTALPRFLNDDDIPF